jgi:hypothetical protein
LIKVEKFALRVAVPGLPLTKNIFRPEEPYRCSGGNEIVIPLPQRHQEVYDLTRASDLTVGDAQVN